MRLNLYKHYNKVIIKLTSPVKMKFSKYTFQITDPKVNANFKTYLQKNAAKYMPF